MLNIIYYRLFLCLKQQFPENAKPAKNSSVSGAYSTKKEHENAFKLCFGYNYWSWQFIYIYAEEIFQNNCQIRLTSQHFLHKKGCFKSRTPLVSKKNIRNQLKPSTFKTACNLKWIKKFLNLLSEEFLIPTLLFCPESACLRKALHQQKLYRASLMH